MAWTEASNVLNAAGLPEFLRRDSSSSTVPAEEEFLQEIATVIPKNIVANRLKFLQGNSDSDSKQEHQQSAHHSTNSIPPTSVTTSHFNGASGERKNSTPSVEKRHAVLAFEPSSNCFTVRDLNTTNGTYLNKRRISEDYPEKVSNLDLLRFGYGPSLYEIRSASLTRAGTGAGGGSQFSGPSSLPTCFPQKTAKEVASRLEQVSVLNEDNKYSRALPPKGSLPRKSLLAFTKSDPGGNDSENDSDYRRNANSASGVLTSDRLFQRKNNNSFHDTSPKSLEYQSNDCNAQTVSGNVMQQQGGIVGRSGISRVSSPSLTLDSGRGSSSAPSSPAKEMSPVQMAAAGGTSAPSVGINSTTTGVGAIGTSSNSSHNASPVFARKLSRPMEYLLGQSEDAQNESGFTPELPASGQSSGIFASYGSSEPLLSFVTNGSSSGCCVSGLSINQKLQRTSSIDNNNINMNQRFPSTTGECEILQITEDYENNEETPKAAVVRKDSLEEEEITKSPVDQANLKVINNNGDIESTSSRLVQPQFIVGGDIMQPDLDVPNEVFGPVSHAEILSRNLCGSSNLNGQHSSPGSARQGNKPVETATGTPYARTRSSSGDGGSSRSTPLSNLYGTPHWWPDSPPPEDVCPPPPASSTNCSPFKKPFSLNNNTCNIANSQTVTAAANRLTGNSSSSSLADHVKDLSLESTHSQKSNRTAPSPLPGVINASGDAMEAKKFTPMAFTIDFSDSEGGASGPTNEAVEAKKAAIAERLSKFAPRHKRSSSETRNDDSVGAKDGEPILSSSLASSRSNSKSNSLGRSQQQQKHSTATTVADSPAALKCASLPKKLAGANSGKHPSGGSSSTNNNDSGLRSLSPETISSTTSSSSRSRPQTETPRLGSGSVSVSKLTSCIPRDSSMTRKAKPQSQSRGGTPATRKTASAEDKINNGRTNKGKVTTKLNDLSKERPKTSPTIAPTPVDKEDTVSEAGTYTVGKETPEVVNARENIEEIFCLDGDVVSGIDKENITRNEADNQTFCAEPGTRDWVREWAELAAKQHQQKARPELPDSQYFLRETETLVSAIQERVSKHMRHGNGVEQLSLDYGVTGSESEDDERTLAHHTPVKSQSQLSTPSSNAGKKRPPSRTSPFHRESSVLSDSGIRRGRIGYDSDLSGEHGLTINQQSIATNNIARGISPKPQVNGNSKFNNVNGGGLRSGGSANTTSSHFARNDGGRFSLRMPKSRTPPAQMPPQGPSRHQQSLYSGNDFHTRGLNGHKPDNMSQSANGKKGLAGAGNKFLNNSGVSQQPKRPSSGNRSNSTLTAKEVELANWKRRKNYDPMKAAAEGKKTTRKSGNESDNGIEDMTTLPPISGSPRVNRRETMMTKSLSFHQESYSPKCGSEDEDMIYIVDEMDSSHSNSPNHLGMTRSYHEDVMYYGMPSSARQKNKLEALDNLVIATIHSLSNKVRASSKNLLEKLQLQHSNDENGALIEEMVNQLKDLEGPTSNSSPNKSPSRELSGTLKNLKKLEQVILVLDKVLCEDFESDTHA